MGLFSKCSRHVARKHEKELEIFVKSNKSDPKQPSITFTIPLVIAKRKQTELEKIMGFIHENIPLNLVRSQLFRDLCKLSISRVFSCLLNKSAILFKMRAIEAF